ncbi:vacuolar calcium ion transporter [Gaeumannomyces tritici R3-111a-1]|uniref:Vacuolar calcium ion transporter n=1 Tax=Gaeumannomyces tritici (strain R3-111a-1) TaxID=644352 RepID=J3P6W2_GAET3|nr:vacuolar calcium ion transporter [Gaeumannomyces tritici R3-111a-1]EJT72388.1 vacuolar calcium ion transporter [Gaeumannomyces tritici R3-111a-1]
MHRIRRWAREKARRQPARRASLSRNARNANTPSANTTVTPRGGAGATQDATQDSSGRAGSALDPSAAAHEDGKLTTDDDDGYAQKSAFQRFLITMWDVLIYSYLNLLLVFVPVGIAAHFAHLSGGIVFSMNAIAIIPLAGLLSHATESVAARLGDTIGALMNVTFGNAVELIIFIIALVKNEIRIVQASLLGSILANLLLILGMCFLLGGLRFREQIYNSTVTQMSACLLSLSVTSLLLPTAFHASFSNMETADVKVLQVSRGVSVILLLVYGLYLIFQLNSHSYMYESTPQHIIDQEMVPGPAANYFNGSSSSSSDSSSSSSSDSDSSNYSRSTAKKIKRAVKRAANRRHSMSSSDSRPDRGATDRSVATEKSTPLNATSPATDIPAFMPDGTDATPADDEAEGGSNLEKTRKKKKGRKHRKHRHRHHKRRPATESTCAEQQPGSQTEQPLFAPIITTTAPEDGEPRRVDFALAPDVEAQAAPQSRPFLLRALRPTMPKTISQTVFSPPPPLSPAQPLRSPLSLHSPAHQQSHHHHHHHRERGPRRANSLPSFHPEVQPQHLLPGAIPPIVPIVVNSTPRRASVVTSGPDANNASPGGEIGDDESGPHRQMSRTTAVILLLVSTGLVAICAEFMVDAIGEVVQGSAVSEAFIGLILLPIVGNAAEHTTAVTVAMKNKMDLAIGVALGSSIQIAIFITPLVVILGWIMGKKMSLYFTLFETVSMFVSAFIVNFLVLDGRSNYLEGALLCSAYVIISVAAFYYPNAEAANLLGGGADDGNATVTATVTAIAATVTGNVTGRAFGFFT